MARVYMITEEEMQSLIDSLELQKFRDNNIWHDRPEEPVTADGMHRAFHYVVVRWAQGVGFKGHR